MCNKTKSVAYMTTLSMRNVNNIKRVQVCVASLPMLKRSNSRTFTRKKKEKAKPTEIKSATIKITFRLDVSAETWTSRGGKAGERLRRRSYRPWRKRPPDNATPLHRGRFRSTSSSFFTQTQITARQGGEACECARGRAGEGRSQKS